MRIRQVYIMKDEIVPDVGTVVKDIKLTTPILALEVRYQQTVDTSDYDDHPLHKDVSKIEVVDGSDVLASLSMIEAQGLNCYHIGRFPLMETNTRGGSVNKESAIIPFGRGLWDTEYMLDPTRFTNPQIKLTHSLTTGAGYWTAGGTQVTIIAYTIEDPKVKPAAFLMNKEIWSATLGTSGDRTIELPVDYPYRMLLVRAYYSGERADEDVTNIKLSCDHGKFVPIDISTNHLNMLLKNRFGYFQDLILASKQDNEVVYSRLQKTEDAQVQVQYDFVVSHVEGIDAEKITLGMYILTTTPTIAKETTDRQVVVVAKGLQPHGMFLVPLGSLEVPEQYFPAPDFGSVDLILTQGGSGAEGAVVLQQVRRY